MQYKVRKFNNNDLKSFQNVLKQSAFSTYVGMDEKITRQDILDSFDKKSVEKYKNISLSKLPPLSESKYFRYVLLCDERIVGVCTIQVGIGKNLTSPRIAVLRQLYLLPSYQGKGKGEFLMKKSFAFSRVSNIPIFLEVARANSGAISFYHRHGFKDTKKRGTYAIGKKSLETMVMIKNILAKK